MFRNILISSFLCIVILVGCVLPSPPPSEVAGSETPVITTPPLLTHQPPATKERVISTPSPTPMVPTQIMPSETASEPLPTSPPPAPTAIPAYKILGYWYMLQPGTPQLMMNFTHPNLGCNWLGVGGQAFGFNNAPVKQLVVEIGGTLDGQAISQLTLTGSSPLLGEGGYEFTLVEHPVGSSASIWLQLSDLNGNKISDKIYLNTYADCDKNFILVNFIKVDTTRFFQYYFPFIFNNFTGSL